MTTTDHDSQDFDTTMRAALRDDMLWGALTSTVEGLCDVDRWLKTTVNSIGQQLSFRRDEVEAARHHGGLGPGEIVEYHQWRKRAVFLKSLCEQRLADIKPLRAEVFGEDRAQRMKDLLVRLAGAVADHEAGDLSDTGLHAQLDAILLPGEDAPTLREHLGRRAERLVLA